jgi:GNAT superfamily N-acetyltransferase
MNRLPYGTRLAVLRCGRCGRFVDWAESRVQVVCGCRPHFELPPVLVRDATPADRQRALALFKRDFGRTRLVAASGEPASLEDAPTLVAETEDEIAGALAWRPGDGAIHILALATDPMWQRAGVGGHLVAEVELMARRDGRPRLVVTIGNDNIPALYFFQRRGFRISAVVPDSMAPHAGAEPAAGFAGIPVLDEIQLAKQL